MACRHNTCVRLGQSQQALQAEVFLPDCVSFDQLGAIGIDLPTQGRILRPGVNISRHFLVEIANADDDGAQARRNGPCHFRACVTQRIEPCRVSNGNDQQQNADERAGDRNHIAGK